MHHCAYVVKAAPHGPAIFGKNGWPAPATSTARRRQRSAADQAETPHRSISDVLLPLVIRGQLDLSVGVSFEPLGTEITRLVRPRIRITRALRVDAGRADPVPCSQRRCRTPRAATPEYPQQSSEHGGRPRASESWVATFRFGPGRKGFDTVGQLQLSAPAARVDHRVDTCARDGAQTLLGDDQLPDAGIERGDRTLDGDLHLAGRGRGSAAAGISIFRSKALGLATGLLAYFSASWFQKAAASVTGELLGSPSRSAG